MKVPITEETDQPVTDTSPTEPVIRKRRSHPLLVTLLLIILVILAGSAAVLGYAYYFQRPTFPSLTTNTPMSNTQTVDKLLGEIAAVFNGKPMNNPSLALPIKVAGYNFYTEIDSSRVKGRHASVAYTDSALATAKIAKVLKQNQFAETIVQSGSGESEYIANYTHSDAVCSVTATKTANNPTGNHDVAITCANMSDYTSTAAAQKPFYDTYPNKPSDATTNILFIGHATISPSQSAGYQTASIPIGGVAEDGTPVDGSFLGLYYQTPDKTWHFFKSSQNELPCSDYVNPDAKKAYAGTECTDANGAKTHVAA